MQTKKILAPLAISVLVMGVLLVSPQAYAQTPGAQHTNFLQNLVEMIAQKFGLDKTQVQNVVDNYKNQQIQKMQQNMQAREKARLDQLVQSGKITSAQEQAIITELTALRNKYNPANMKNLTPDQRRTQRQNMKNELDAWAKSQGIDPSILLPGFGMGMGRGRGMMGKWGQPATSPSPAT